VIAVAVRWYLRYSLQFNASVRLSDTRNQGKATAGLVARPRSSWYCWTTCAKPVLRGHFYFESPHERAQGKRSKVIDALNRGMIAKMLLVLISLLLIATTLALIARNFRKCPRRCANSICEVAGFGSSPRCLLWRWATTSGVPNSIDVPSGEVKAGRPEGRPADICRNRVDNSLGPAATSLVVRVSAAGDRAPWGTGQRKGS
jgi:hypothetical protein